MSSSIVSPFFLQCSLHWPPSTSTFSIFSIFSFPKPSLHTDSSSFCKLVRPSSSTHSCFFVSLLIFQVVLPSSSPHSFFYRSPKIFSYHPPSKFSPDFSIPSKSRHHKSHIHYSLPNCLNFHLFMCIYICN